MRGSAPNSDVCSYIMKRTQIYVDEEQDRRLAERAGDLGVTKSELIRQAVDQLLDRDDEAARLKAFRSAVRRTAGAAPSLPPGPEYVDELRQADSDRMQELLERFR